MIYRNLSEDLEIKNLDDYWNFIENNLQNFIEGEEANKTKSSIDALFLTLKERKDYLYVLPEIKYLNKTLDQLSAIYPKIRKWKK